MWNMCVVPFSVVMFAHSHILGISEFGGVLREGASSRDSFFELNSSCPKF